MRRGRPPLPERAIAVIRQFAQENPRWKIREIAKKATAYLGLSICAATVRRYLLWATRDDGANRTRLPNAGPPSSAITPTLFWPATSRSPGLCGAERSTCWWSWRSARGASSKRMSAPTQAPRGASTSSAPTPSTNLCSLDIVAGVHRSDFTDSKVEKVLTISTAKLNCDTECPAADRND